jgi:hypothetical protein
MTTDEILTALTDGYDNSTVKISRSLGPTGSYAWLWDINFTRSMGRYPDPPLYVEAKETAFTLQGALEGIKRQVDEQVKRG